MTNDDKESFFFWGYHIFRQNEMKWDHLKWDHCAGSIDWLSSFFFFFFDVFLFYVLEGSLRLAWIGHFCGALLVE